MPRTSSPTSGVIPSALGTRLTRLVNFGLVGGLAFLVDIGIYNLLRLTVMDDKPIGAKVISVAVATLVAWLGNRHLTFRAERSARSGSVVREGVLFALMNVIGLLISAACLFVSHYLLGFTSQLADNIAGNVVGLVLGMVFRFVAYRYIVFRPSAPSTAGHPNPTAALTTAQPASAQPASAQPSTAPRSPALPTTATRSDPVLVGHGPPAPQTAPVSS